MKIILPDQIKADGVLPFIAQLRDPKAGEEIVLDFSGLCRITPTGLVTLAATVVRWRREHRPFDCVA